MPNNALSLRPGLCGHQHTLHLKRFAPICHSQRRCVASSTREGARSLPVSIATPALSVVILTPLSPVAQATTRGFGEGIVPQRFPGEVRGGAQCRPANSEEWHTRARTEDTHLAITQPFITLSLLFTNSVGDTHVAMTALIIFNCIIQRA